MKELSEKRERKDRMKTVLTDQEPVLELMPIRGAGEITLGEWLEDWLEYVIRPNREDTTYYFGEYCTEDGQSMYRVAIAENGTHWHSPSYPELIWDYVSQFSRNTETGELVIAQ